MGRTRALVSGSGSPWHAGGCVERRGVLVVSHRLEPVRTADRVLVVDAGTIVAEGTGTDVDRPESPVGRRLFAHASASVDASP